MQITQKSRRPKMVGSMITALLIGFCAGGLVVFFQNFSLNDLEQETPTEERVVSMFEFTNTSGWRQGPHNETSRVVFSKARADGTSACFVSAQYKRGTVDVGAALQKQQEQFVGSGGSMARVSVVPSTLRTNNGDKPYDLYRFSVTGGSTERLMGGLELGYIQLDSGYVQIEGHCETLEELETTMSALQAYKLLQ